MVDVNSLMDNPIVWIVIMVIAVFLIRKAYRKVMGFVFSALAILKLVHYFFLLL
jgi:hypothetical protein